MKISIITPTLNAEDVIEDAILSVLNQSTSDYEHIIIDASSSDGTMEIVSKYEHLICVSEPDEGVYYAMNKGLSLARGDWIYFLGADDRLSTEHVLCAVSRDLVEPYDVVYGDVVSDRFNGRYGGEFDYQKLYGSNICHQAIFFHRELFKKVGNFDLKYPAQSDWDHNLRWLSNSDIKVRYIDLVIANFADGGLSSALGDKIFQRDRRFNYLQYGYAALSLTKFIKLLTMEILQSLRIGHFIRAYQCFHIGLKYLTRKSGSRS